MERPWPTINLLREALNAWQQESAVEFAWSIDKRDAKEWQLSCDDPRCPVKLVTQLQEQEGEPAGWLVTCFITQHSHGEADAAQREGGALDSVLDQYRPPEPELPPPEIAPPKTIKRLTVSPGPHKPTKRPLDIDMMIFEVAEDHEVQQALSPAKKKRKLGATADTAIQIIDLEEPDSDLEIVKPVSKTSPSKVETPAKVPAPRQHSEESLPKASPLSRELPKPAAIEETMVVVEQEEPEPAGEMLVNEKDEDDSRNSFLRPEDESRLTLTDKWTSPLLGPPSPSLEADASSREGSSISASHEGEDAESARFALRGSNLPEGASGVREETAEFEMEVDELVEEADGQPEVQEPHRTKVDGRHHAIAYTDREDAWLCERILEHRRVHGRNPSALLRHIAALQDAQPKRALESYRRRWVRCKTDFDARILALAKKVSLAEHDDVAHWLRTAFRKGPETSVSQPKDLPVAPSVVPAPAAEASVDSTTLAAGESMSKPATLDYVPPHKAITSLRVGLDELVTHFEGILLPNELEGLPLMLHLAGVDEFEQLKGLTKNEFADFLMENDVYPTTARRLAEHLEAGKFIAPKPGDDCFTGSLEAFLARLHPTLGQLAHSVFLDCAKPSDLKFKKVRELTVACEGNATKCTQLQRLLLVNRLGAVRRFL